MEMQSRTITSLINKEYLAYSKYTVYHRAIPSEVDGFKPSQRKAFFVVPPSAGLKKVQSVAGKMISDAEYNHGDASGAQTISKMAQDFPGSNNIPVFRKKGSFGSRFVREPAQPRYIYVNSNPQFYGLFKDKELCPKNDNPENPEPEYYLPIIPTLLLNGVSGIAVGFACEILPYEIGDIIHNIRKMLENQENPDFDMMYPWFGDFNGTVEWDDENKRFFQRGVFEVVNTTTIKITELPTGMDRERYKTHLIKLQDKKLISSFEIDGKGNRWNIKIRLPRASKVFKNPENYLKLTQALSENLTVIDHKGNIVIYDNVYSYLYHFVKFRLGIYRQRINYMLAKIKEDAALCFSKIRFIKEISGVDLKSMTKSDIWDMIKERIDISDDHLGKCLEMKSYRLSADHIDELKKRILELKKEFEWYKKITPEELYEIDLKEIS